MKWLALNRKAAVIIWYLVLWGVCAWAIFELFYPHTDYGNSGVMYYFAAGFSLLLLGATGVPLFLYVKKREVSRQAMRVMLAATVLLAVVLAPNAYVSAVNKSMTQWYVSDLQNQGFNVEYSPSYPYGHWGVNYVDSYAELTSVARDINCSTVHVYGGVPTYFVFFVHPVEIVAANVGVGYYMYNEG
jgi:hypothetical protein